MLYNYILLLVYWVLGNQNIIRLHFYNIILTPNSNQYQ